MTLITWGAMTKEARRAVSVLAAEGVSVELIDLRSLVPLDEDAIVASVQKTGRAVVVHEAPRTGGFGAEIAALIQERCLYALSAPVQTGYRLGYRVSAETIRAPLPAIGRADRRRNPTHSGGVMVKEFRLPDIGEGLTEAEIIRWLIPEGGAVKADQPVVEVETDKAVVEIPSPYSGFVLHHGGSEGQTLAVGDVLMVIGDEGEEWAPPSPVSNTKVGVTSIPSEEVVDEVNEDVATEEGMPEPGTPGNSPGIEQSASVQPIVGSLSEDAVELAPRQDRVASALAGAQALPVVRKLAKDLDVDLDTVTGTGPDGRIVREDVIAAAEAKAAESGGSPSKSAADDTAANARFRVRASGVQCRSCVEPSLRTCRSRGTKSRTSRHSTRSMPRGCWRFARPWRLATRPRSPWKP